jgi:hypothetical protein
VNDKIKLKRGTTSQWAAANPILLQGEAGIDTTENRVKYGDGSTAWSGLAFSSPKITVGTAAPSGGNDGDIYLQYSP